MLKKFLSLFLVGVVALSLCACGESGGSSSTSNDGGSQAVSKSNKNMKFNDEDFKDFFYYYVEDEVIHLTSEPIDGKTKILKAGESLDWQISGIYHNYNRIVFDNYVLLNDAEGMFSHLTGEIENIDKLIVKGSAGSMFAQASIICDFGRMNTSYITNMRGMFAYCHYENLNLNAWDVSNVVEMYDMFRQCDKLKTLDVGKWDVSSVTDMSGMFDGACWKLKTLDVSKWDVSNVTDMSAMFSRSAFTTLDVSKWDVSNVTDMCEMFCGCNLEKLDVSKWDVSNVTDMSYMFDDCESLEKLDVSKWKVKQEVISNYESIRKRFE